MGDCSYYLPSCMIGLPDVPCTIPPESSISLSSVTLSSIPLLVSVAFLSIFVISRLYFPVFPIFPISSVHCLCVSHPCLQSDNTYPLRHIPTIHRCQAVRKFPDYYCSQVCLYGFFAKIYHSAYLARRAGFSLLILVSFILYKSPLFAYKRLPLCVPSPIPCPSAPKRPSFV